MRRSVLVNINLNECDNILFYKYDSLKIKLSTSVAVSV